MASWPRSQGPVLPGESKGHRFLRSISPRARARVSLQGEACEQGRLCLRDYLRAGEISPQLDGFHSAVSGACPPALPTGTQGSPLTEMSTPTSSGIFGTSLFRISGLSDSMKEHINAVHGASCEAARNALPVPLATSPRVLVYLAKTTRATPGADQTLRGHSENSQRLRVRPALRRAAPQSRSAPSQLPRSWEIGVNHRGVDLL